jgi:hypothetical protein
MSQVLPWPLGGNAELAKVLELNSSRELLRPDRRQTERFARELFEGMTGFVALRGIPEPAGAGRWPTEQWVPIDGDMPKVVGDFVEQCAASGHAAFVLPHPVQAGQGGLKGILAQRVIPIDLDKGDIAAKTIAITEALGEPWIAVESGGIEAGQPKWHLYYRLNQDAGAADFARVARVREDIAHRFGADMAIGRNPAQILRLPGSLHRKGEPALCVLRSITSTRTPLAVLENRIGIFSERANVAAFNFDFSHDAPGPTMDRVLMEPILAEGKSPDGVTRYEGAGDAIGHYIRCARDGRISLEEARQAARDWNAAVLNPPWSDELLQQHFDRLLKRDVANHGLFPSARTPASEWARFDEWDGNAFNGVPAPRRYLIDGSLPLGVPGVVAAAGGLGKSYLMLDLALRVATGAPASGMDFNERSILGGNVREFGTAVLFLSEDDKTTVHERLAALDPSQVRRQEPKRLRVIPLPDAGGARALFSSDREGFKTTPEFEAIRAWLKSLPDLKLVVFDPLQTFVAADITAKPEAGQFVMSTLGTLAAELGATVLVTHHLNKNGAVTGPEEARAAIRGTTALVDGVRWVYALWAAEDAAAAGAVVKTNGAADSRVHKYQRLPFGVLRQLAPGFDPEARADLLDRLAAAIAQSATAGTPFALTGVNGLYAQRNRLPEAFHRASRAALETAAQELLNAGRLVKGTARGTTGRSWLDVPEGDFAIGHGVLMSGAGAIAA